MDINDRTIVTLRRAVSAAQEEFDLAVTFHELWKVAAFDTKVPNGWAPPTPLMLFMSCAWLFAGRRYLH